MNAAGDAIAVVDLAPWRSGHDPRTAAQLVDSFRRTGFAYLTGHGVPPDLVASVFAAARDFFNQDPAQLDAVHQRHANNYRGYVPGRVIPGVGSLHDEIFDCGIELPPTYRGPGEVMRNTRNLWPAALPGFRPVVERYQAAVRRLADELLSAIAVGLTLPADFFRVRCAEPHAQLRLLHYRPRPDAPDDALSAGRHSDYEAITILAQDDVGGLQVRDPSGAWVDVAPRENAFVINAGDLLTRWTNGAIPATPHRVRTPRDRDRYSVAFFYGTSYDVLIEPALPPATGDGQRYEPITTGEYLYRRYVETGA